MKKKNLYKIINDVHKNHTFYDWDHQKQWEDELLIEHFYFNDELDCYNQFQKEFSNGEIYYYKNLCNTNNIHHWFICSDSSYSIVHYVHSIDRYVSLMYNVKSFSPLSISLSAVFVFMEYFDWGTLDD